MSKINNTTNPVIRSVVQIFY